MEWDSEMGWRWDGMEVGRDGGGVGWGGMIWDGMGWHGIGWDGVICDGTGSDGRDRIWCGTT